MSKEKILEEFDEKFNHPNLWCDCAMEYDNERQRNGVKQFISDIITQTREETIREVEGILEEITPAYIGVLESNNNRRYYEQGFGEYKEEIKQSLKSLINK